MADSNEKSGIEEFYDHLGSVDADVREILCIVYDDIGRPQTEFYVGVVKLLDISDTYQEFYEKFKAFLGEHCSLSEYEIENKAKSYYHCYAGGIRRLERDLKQTLDIE